MHPEDKRSSIASMTLARQSSPQIDLPGGIHIHKHRVQVIAAALLALRFLTAQEPVLRQRCGVQLEPVVRCFVCQSAHALLDKAALVTYGYRSGSLCTDVGDTLETQTAPDAALHSVAVRHVTYLVQESITWHSVSG